MKDQVLAFNWNSNDSSLLKERETDLTDAFDLVKEDCFTTDDIEAYINGLIGELYETASDPFYIQITNYNKTHILYSNVKLRKNSLVRHNAALIQLDEIINRAMYSSNAPVDSSHNTRKRTIKHKEGLLRYVYLKSPVRIGVGENTKHFTVELVAEVVRGQDPNILDLYNVRVKKVEPSERDPNVTSSPDSNCNLPSGI